MKYLYTLLVIALFGLAIYAGQTNYSPNIGTSALTTPIIIEPVTNSPTDGYVISATGNHTKWVAQSGGPGGGGFTGNPNQFSISGTSTNIINGALFTNIISYVTFRVTNTVGGGSIVISNKSISFHDSADLLGNYVFLDSGSFQLNAGQFTDGVNSALVVSNGLIGAMRAATNSGNIQSATFNATGQFNGSGAGLTSIPEAGVSSLTTDLAAKFGTLVATTTGLTTSGNGTSTATISSPSFVLTNGISIAVVASNSFTIRDSTGASVVISNGVIGTVQAITNVGNIQTATINATGAGTFGGTGASIFNGGITNFAGFTNTGPILALDSAGARLVISNGVIGTMAASTNTGNAQSATLNTTGAASHAGVLTANANIIATGSNFVGLVCANQVSWQTNLGIQSPDFSKGFTVIPTNTTSAIQILSPIGIDAAKLTWQSVVTRWTNSGTVAALIAPANVHTNGTWNVTNVTDITWDYQPPNGPTQAVAFPRW